MFMFGKKSVYKKIVSIGIVCCGLLIPQLIQFSASAAEAVPTNLLAGVIATEYTAGGDMGGANDLGTILTDTQKNVPSGTNKWYWTNPSGDISVVYEFGETQTFNTVKLYSGMYQSRFTDNAQDRLNGYQVNIEYDSGDATWNTAYIYDVDEELYDKDPIQLVTLLFNRITAQKIRITFEQTDPFRVMEIEAYNILRADRGLNLLSGKSPETYTEGGDTGGAELTILTDGEKGIPAGANKWYWQSPNSSVEITYTFADSASLNTIILYGGWNEYTNGRMTRTRKDGLEKDKIEVAYRTSAGGEWSSVNIGEITEEYTTQSASQEVWLKFNTIEASELKITFTQTTAFRVLEIEAFDIARDNFDSYGMYYQDYDYNVYKNVLFGIDGSKIRLSEPCEPVNLLIDGQRENASGAGDTKWYVAASDNTNWVEFNLDTVVEINKAIVTSSYSDTDHRDTLDTFYVQYKSGDEWVMIPGSLVTENSKRIAEVDFEPVKSNAFRLVTDTKKAIRIREIQFVATENVFVKSLDINGGQEVAIQINKATDQHLAAVVAVYNEHRLKYVAMSDEMNDDLGVITKTLSGDFNISEGDEVKVFLWEMKDGILECTPLSAAYNIYIHDETYEEENSLKEPKVLTTAEIPEKENLHIYLAIGQSNMAGRAPIEKQDEIVLGENILLYNAADSWELAQPWLVDGVMQGFNRYSNVIGDSRNEYLSPAFYFAKHLGEYVPENVSIGIVSNARGNTQIEQWSKGYTATQTREDYDLFENTVARAKKAMETGVLKGIIWHQGEANTWNSNEYISKLNKFVDDLREELGVTAEEVPFIAGELGDFFNDAEKINSVLPDFVSAERNTDYIVLPEGLESIGDNIHFNAPAQRIIGELYAQKMFACVYEE